MSSPIPLDTAALAWIATNGEAASSFGIQGGIRVGCVVVREDHPVGDEPLLLIAWNIRLHQIGAGRAQATPLGCSHGFEPGIGFGQVVEAKLRHLKQPSVMSSLLSSQSSALSTTPLPQTVGTGGSYVVEPPLPVLPGSVVDGKVTQP